jgi:IS5 family transposase
LFISSVLFKADKEYLSEKNRKLLKTRKLKNYILKKAKKGTPLKESEKRCNQLIGKTRFKVARTFRGIRSWFNGERQDTVVFKKCMLKI